VLSCIKFLLLAIILGAVACTSGKYFEYCTKLKMKWNVDNIKHNLNCSMRNSLFECVLMLNCFHISNLFLIAGATSSHKKSSKFAWMNEPNETFLMWLASIFYTIHYLHCLYCIVWMIC
jgi:hypothetical protein